MKKTQLIDLVQTIKGTLVSFVAITLFVTLGVALFLGIHATVITLQNAANNVFDLQDHHHFEVDFPYGITDEDLEAIAEIEGVDQVVPGYMSYQLHDVDGVSHPLAVRSVVEGVNVCEVVDGRLPEKAGEIAISKEYSEDSGLSIGDTLRFMEDAEDPLDGSEPDPDGMRLLVTSEYTVVGIIHNPIYLSEAGGGLGATSDGASNEGFAFLHEASYDRSAFFDAYPVVYLRSDSLVGLHTFADDYQAINDAIKDRIQALGDERAPVRYDSVYGEVKASFDEAEKQIEDGRTQLEEGQQAIEDGERAIEIGEVQLESAIAQLESGQATYEATASQGSQMLGAMEGALSQLQTAYDTAKAALDANAGRVDELAGEVKAVADEISTLRKTINENIEYLNELDQELTDGKITGEEYAERRKQIADALNMAVDLFKLAAKTLFPQIAERYPALLDFPKIDLDVPGWEDTAKNKLAEYDAYADGAKTMLEQAQSELAGVQSEVDRLSSRLSDGWSRLNDARNRFYAGLDASAARIAEGQAQIEEGQTTLDEKTTELEEGKELIEEKTAELEEGERLLDEARSRVEAMVPMDWIVQDRFMGGGMMILRNIMTLTGNLRYVLASLFIIVGMLVCFSAISRIVHEQSTRIGAKKALGFRESEITAGFLGYTLIAVVLGTILGVLMSVFVVQNIYYSTLAQSFSMPRVPLTVQLPDTLFIFVLEAVLLLGITWFACHSILKRSAVSLLSGEQTANGRTRFYERWPIWHKLPLFTQTVINNCVNDPRRVFATIVGVAGCTALIVTAITLDDNIQRSIRDHYGLVYEFDSYVSFDPDVEGAKEALDEALDELGCRHTLTGSAMLILGEGRSYNFTHVYVPSDEEEFAELFHLKAVGSTGTAYGDGVWISRCYADHKGGKVGDIIHVSAVNGVGADLRIAGFFEYYLPYSAFIVTPAYYEECFGAPVEYGCYLVDTSNVGFEEMRSALSGIEGVTVIFDDKAASFNIASMFTNLTRTVVIVYVGLSAIMAVMVLLNLDYMFIDEKKRELITLMINGFSVKDAKAYIYRDAILMTILGVLVGLALGIVIGTATVGAVEWDNSSFMKTPNLKACLIAAGLATSFAAAMMLVALRRIPRFSLTDISKY